MGQTEVKTGWDLGSIILLGGLWSVMSRKRRARQGEVGVISQGPGCEGEGGTEMRDEPFTYETPPPTQKLPNRDGER